MSNQPAVGVPWSRFAHEVMLMYQPPMRRKKTYDKTRLVLSEFGNLCTETTDLGPLVIAEWISKYPNRSPGTVESLLRHLQAACTYAVSRGWMSPPFGFRPVSKWVPADERLCEDSFPKHRSAHEIRCVLEQADAEARAGDWCERRLQALVYCLAFTGAHKTEITGIRTKDLDLDLGVIRIRSHPKRRLKTSARAADLPIAEPAARVLTDWATFCNSDYLFPHKRLDGPWLHGRPGHTPLDAVRKLGERAGVRGLTIISFRHSFATLAEGWGIGELMLQRLLRHSNARTQRHYRHSDRNLMADAIAKVRFNP